MAGGNLRLREREESGMSILDTMKTGANAVAGLLIFCGAIAMMISVLIWIEKAPEFLAIVISAAMVSAALFFRKERNVYNVTLGHPDSAEIIAKLNKILADGDLK